VGFGGLFFSYLSSSFSFDFPTGQKWLDFGSSTDPNEAEDLSKIDQNHSLQWTFSAFILFLSPLYLFSVRGRPPMAVSVSPFALLTHGGPCPTFFDRSVEAVFFPSSPLNRSVALCISLQRDPSLGLPGELEPAVQSPSRSRTSLLAFRRAKHVSFRT